MERTREETGEKVGNEKIGKLREMEGKDEECEEMHCVGSRKWKAKGGNVKGRKSRAKKRKGLFLTFNTGKGPPSPESAIPRVRYPQAQACQKRSC